MNEPNVVIVPVAKSWFERNWRLLVGVGLVAFPVAILLVLLTVGSLSDTQTAADERERERFARQAETFGALEEDVRALEQRNAQLEAQLRANRIEPVPDTRPPSPRRRAATPTARPRPTTTTSSRPPPATTAPPPPPSTTTTTTCTIDNPANGCILR